LVVVVELELMDQIQFFQQLHLLVVEHQVVVVVLPIMVMLGVLVVVVVHHQVDLVELVEQVIHLL
tara:strand:+ start:95 stop:289 length:195 start_codon:yes stop_codon:yes gene_type:complete